MSGETGSDVSGWTPDTLKVLEDEKIAALERLVTAEIRRLEEQTEAINRLISTLSEERVRAQEKFEATVRDGFVKQNEFRGSLDDLGKQMQTRREAEIALAASQARTEEQGRQIAELRSRLDIGPSAIPSLQAYQQHQTGRQAGIGASLAVIVTAVFVAAALVGLIATLVAHG